MEHSYENNQDMLMLDLPASLKYMSVLGACVSAFIQQQEDSTDVETLTAQVQLAIHEVCINVVEHTLAGAPGRLIISFGILPHPRRLVFEIRDTGPAPDPRTWDWLPITHWSIQHDPKGIEFKLKSVPEISPDQTRGRGLYLIRHLMDEVVLMTRSDGNRWRLTKFLR